MATFEKYTSGFVVNGTNVGIQPVIITKDVDDKRIVSATQGTDNGQSIPTVQKVEELISSATVDKATSAAHADKLTTGRVIASTGDVSWNVTFDGSQNVTGTASITNVPWTAIDHLATTDTTSTTGFMTPDAVQDAIDAKITNVYIIKGSCDFADIPTTGMHAGDVWSVKTSGTLTTVDGTNTVINPGDNIVYTEAGWDKLAGSINITGKLDTADFNTWSAARFNNTSALYAVNATSASVAYDAQNLGGITATSIISSANSGAAASAWIDANKDNLLTSVETTGYVIGDGTTANKIDLTTDTKSKIDNSITAASYTTTSNTFTFTKNNGDSITAEIPVVAVTKDYAYDGLMSSADKAALNTLTSVSGNFITSAYTKVTVNGAQTEANGKDTIGFSGGQGITLTPTADAYGHPTITIAANGGDYTFTATNGISYTTATTANGVTVHKFSGINATTADAGVVKADYLDESTGLIHLF